MVLENFCHDPFWNSSLTWYTEVPELTRCFEKTVLILVPCLFLWTFSPLEIFYLSKSKTRNVPWSWLNIFKLCITAILILVLVGEFISSLQLSSGKSTSFDVNVCASLIKLLTVAYSGVLVLYNKKYGMHTSGLLCLFWIFVTICGIPQFRTDIGDLESSQLLNELYGLHVFGIFYFVLIVTMCLLNCLPDKPPTETLYAKTKHPCPYLTASFLSRLTFNWFNGMIILGYKRPIEEQDLWDITPQNSVAEIFPVFENHWKKNVERRKKLGKKGSFIPAFFKTFSGMLTFLTFFRILTDIFTFANPKILGFLITYVKAKQELWKGILYAILLFVSAAVKTFVSQEYFNRNELISLRIRSALIPLIYKKALVITNNVRKETTVGEIMNLMSIDANRFSDIGNTLNILWSGPFQIAVSTYFLWQELGPSILAGIAVLLIILPVNGVIATYSKKLNAKNMKIRDERVKLMNEILNGIRVLKLYAWEKSFEEQVTNVRNKELEVLKKSRYLGAVTTFLMYCSPIMVALASFTTYVFIDEKHVLDANKAFVSLSLFNIMRNPLQQLPNIITNLLHMLVSSNRINNFLNAEEMEPNIVQHDYNKEYPVTIENGTFSWGEQTILENVNFSLKQKTLSAVVGTVGAGKTSLLGAILGEMEKLNGKVNTYGKIGYVSQQAWIQNATLKDNILFGKPFDDKRYKKIIEACALKTDFEILPAGDQTEIGEKGINLSGGQKQRISLARAVYADADIYLLDDPLSAVDSHVGKHIFEKVIGPQGLLKHKTKLLVTHAVTYLPQCHQVIVIKDGFISEIGTYQELVNKNGDFAEFMQQHSAGNVVNEELTEEQIEQNESYLNKENSRLSLAHSEVTDSEYQSNGSLARITGSIKEKLSIVECNLNKKEVKFKKGERLIENEKAEIGDVRKNVYNYYFRNVGYNMILVIFGIQIVTQCLDIASNAWLGEWSEDDTIIVDNVVNTGKRDMYLGVYGVIGLGQAMTIIAYSILYALATLRAGEKIHRYLLEKVMRFPMFFFDVTPIGRILVRFSSDINGIDVNLPHTCQNVLNNTIKVFGMLGVITYSTPWFLTVVVPLFVLYYVIQRLYIASNRQLRRLVSIFRSPLYSHFGESITGVQTIRAFGEQERFNLECHSRVDRTQAGHFPQLIAYRWLAIRLEMIGNVITLFAAIFAVLATDMSPGLVGLSLTYAMQVTNTLKMLVNMASNVETNIVSVERIKEYQDLEEEAAWEKPDNAPKSWPSGGCLEFKNFGIRYRKGLDLVLKNLDIRIDAGHKVGVVGRTGAGKSSLTLGLFRLIEAADGQINIDGINIADLGLQKLRSALTIIPQDPVLFAGSLRINLDPFDKYSDTELWKALELAHLKQYVEGLPAGLQHEIYEGGQNLSTGQKQLVCLARALLRKTKILILDEATAAIDLETDDLIQETIRREFKECTVLTIAHRLNTIMDSDRIIVLDKGQIVEFDSPTNLLANTESVFYGMCKDAGLC